MHRADCRALHCGGPAAFALATEIAATMRAEFPLDAASEALCPAAVVNASGARVR